MKEEFKNIYGEQISKKEYVEDKIDILDDFMLFTRKSVADKVEPEDRKYWVRRILAAQDTSVQMDNLCQMLTVKDMPIDAFIKRYSKEYLGI